MRNILITGGAGFIGSHLVAALLAEKSWRVTAIDDFNDFYDPAIKRRNLQAHSDDPNFDLVEADICRADRLEAVFSARKFECVVHLAARAGVRPSIEKPDLYYDTNVRGTLNLLEAARRFAVKQFVFGSSSSVYGVGCKIPFVETEAAARPISPYAATKIAGESLCHVYSHLYPMRAVCLRFFTVYGARQRPDLAIHKFTNLISRNQPIQVYGDGRTRRDYTYVHDLIEGVRAAIDYSRSDFEIFNLGNSHAIELRQLIFLLENALGKKAFVENFAAQPGDVPLTYADIGKARKFLNFNPRTKLEIGIENFVRWFLAQNSSL